MSYGSGNVTYHKAAPPSAGGGAAAAAADNGLIVSPGGDVELGQEVGAVGSPAKLLRDTEIPTNGKKIFITEGGDMVIVDPAEGITIINASGNLLKLVRQEGDVSFSIVSPEPHAWNFNFGERDQLAWDYVSQVLGYDNVFKSNGYKGNLAVVSADSEFLPVINSMLVFSDDGMITILLDWAKLVGTIGTVVNCRSANGVTLHSSDPSNSIWDFDNNNSQDYFFNGVGESIDFHCTADGFHLTGGRPRPYVAPAPPAPDTAGFGLQKTGSVFSLVGGQLTADLSLFDLAAKKLLIQDSLLSQNFSLYADGFSMLLALGGAVLRGFSARNYAELSGAALMLRNGYGVANTLTAGSNTVGYTFAFTPGMGTVLLNMSGGGYVPFVMTIDRLQFPGGYKGTLKKYTNDSKTIGIRLNVGEIISGAAPGVPGTDYTVTAPYAIIRFIISGNGQSGASVIVL